MTTRKIRILSLFFVFSYAANAVGGNWWDCFLYCASCFAVHSDEMRRQLVDENPYSQDGYASVRGSEENSSSLQDEIQSDVGSAISTLSASYMRGTNVQLTLCPLRQSFSADPVYTERFAIGQYVSAVNRQDRRLPFLNPVADVSNSEAGFRGRLIIRLVRSQNSNNQDLTITLFDFYAQTGGISIRTPPSRSSAFDVVPSLYGETSELMNEILDSVLGFIRNRVRSSGEYLEIVIQIYGAEKEQRVTSL